MEAVKLLICREWRQVQAFPRFWLVALGLSLLLISRLPFLFSCMVFRHGANLLLR